MRDEKQVWLASLTERCVYGESNTVTNKLYYRAGARGYHPIFTQYGRTDVTRQGIAELFLELSERPDDTLVMCDIDHDHAIETVEVLVGHNKPIVVSLAFRRGIHYDACAFGRDKQGEIHHIAQFGVGVKQVNGVGHPAIAIQRQVFEQLRAAGHHWFWKYEYLDPEPDKGLGIRAPSEDLYFSRICDELDIEMWVDTDFEAPHMLMGYVDRQVHEAYRAEHPELFGPVVTLGELRGETNGTEPIPTESAANGGHSDKRLEQSRADRKAHLVN